MFLQHYILLSIYKGCAEIMDISGKRCNVKNVCFIYCILVKTQISTALSSAYKPSPWVWHYYTFTANWMEKENITAAKMERFSCDEQQTLLCHLWPALYECELQKLRCGQVIDGLIVTRWDFSAFDCSNAFVFLFQRAVNQHCGHTDENIQWLQHHRIKLQSTLFSQHFFD